MNPTFSNGLQTLLFDQLTEDKVKQIDARIKSDLEFYFPKVQVVNISTEGIPETNTVQFALSYKIKDTNIEDELSINFEQ